MWPIGPLQAPGAGFLLTAAGSLGWGAKTRHIKKREGQVLGLRWLPFRCEKQHPTKHQCQWWEGHWRRDVTGADGEQIPANLSWQTMLDPTVDLELTIDV